MFNKKSSFEEKFKTSDSGIKNSDINGTMADVPEDALVRPSENTVSDSKVNKILKGSKLIGDINIACDLELSGDVEGNITSLQKSNILIKGVCKGNIETREGSVNIEGELSGGNITAGKDVRISGKFDGGEVKAESKVFLDGEFNGKLTGNDVEIGPNTICKGEIFYKEYISISKGAKVEVQISQTKEALREIKTSSKKSVEDTEPVKQKVAEK